MRALVLAILLAGCGTAAQQQRLDCALAVSIGALGTGATVAARACDQGQDCTGTLTTAAVAILGAALAAGSTAYLSYDEPAPPASGGPIP